MIKPAVSFSDVLDAAENLSPEEQEALADVLTQRLAERQRDPMNLAVLAACQGLPEDDTASLAFQMDQAYRAGCHLEEEDTSLDPENLMWGILA